MSEEKRMPAKKLLAKHKVTGQVMTVCTFWPGKFPDSLNGSPPKADTKWDKAGHTFDPATYFYDLVDVKPKGERQGAGGRSAGGNAGKPPAGDDFPGL